jgi:hypothetical protein
MPWGARLFLKPLGRRYGVAAASYGLGKLAASRQQIYFENVVKFFPERDLNRLAQTGRWSANAEHRSLREENNLAFSGLIEVNSHKGLIRPIRSPGGTVSLGATTYGDRIPDWHCHLDGPLSEA